MIFVFKSDILSIQYVCYITSHRLNRRVHERVDGLHSVQPLSVSSVITGFHTAEDTVATRQKVVLKRVTGLTYGWRTISSIFYCTLTNESSFNCWRFQPVDVGAPAGDAQLWSVNLRRTFFRMKSEMSHWVNASQCFPQYIWAWNEDSSTIVQKYYFYYVFQERSYLSDHFNPLANYQAKHPTC